ncbi:endonuclease/exonuclease/phosphatase family protein [Streptomyces litchfieldiae]|uniref:Endonuclease/exonuclease/phosphatase family protein n=1 Tax=Streptomyces litchfieldiae TaxID=3075543 RepID=A0ABU2MY59_9ACTN|nr:endonuclease/exonuclease/phosphatase family protein [Streptomyces sp. DSM 44938]MDT0346560.1 endonuclease/exonuclease/phosphatase family protein [Streptomyces sp. DSM 44938]
MTAELRLLSYNVRSLRDDRGALVRVIRAAAPDVVCVQEAPRFFGWRAHAARLARATGLLYVTGGATSCGTLILAAPRVRVERAEDVLFPHTRGLHRRGLATAVLRAGTGPRFAVISCHLSLDAAERHRQAGLLLDRLTALTGPDSLPGVVAGDLNDRPGGATFTRLAGPLTDAWRRSPEGGEHTFPATAPDRRIDAVLCSPGVEVLGCGVPAAERGPLAADPRRAGDHLPLLARLRLP